jgi:hypothetical protein
MSIHVHDWQPQPGIHRPTDYRCTSCKETTVGCTECDTPLAGAAPACRRCLDRTRRVITDVRDWTATLGLHPATTPGLRAVRYDRTRTGTDVNRLPFGLDVFVDDPTDTRIAAIRHPAAAVAILADWADAWAEIRHEPHPAHPLSYLADTDHIRWAMTRRYEADFDQYLDEAHQVRAVVRRLLGIADEPQPVPCVYCGGRVVRPFVSRGHGLEETYRCTRCRTEWPTKVRLDHTNAQILHALPATHPGALLALEDVKRIYRGRVRPNLLDLWVHRGRLHHRGLDARGRPVYRLGEVATLCRSVLASSRV